MSAGATPLDKKTPTLDITTRDLIRGKARQVARKAGLSCSELPDLEQDIALHVWERLGRYKSVKSDNAVFVRMLVAHAASTTLRSRLRRSCRAPVSLEDAMRVEGSNWAEPVDPHSMPPSERNTILALDVAAILATLPRDLRRLANTLRTHSVTATARRLGLTRAAVYWRLAAMRARFEAAGLKDNF
jgi:hypothetical protein